MYRETNPARAQWESRVERSGLWFHSNPEPYWTETAHYRFSLQQIETIEAATEELHRLCLTAVEHIVREHRFAELHIPDRAIPYIQQAHEKHHPSILGRFDLAYDGSGPPKLLEYNADTPTMLLESAVIQWEWQEETRLGGDQFNSLHDKLIARWKEIGPRLHGDLYFTAQDTPEDWVTIGYLQDTATQAGIPSHLIPIDQIGWNATRRCFVDKEEQAIVACHKLYPWEWLLEESFSGPLLETTWDMQWLEPIWKMLLSNKAILPILWELFPDHPNLLEASFAPLNRPDVVSKPFLSREGANITIDGHERTIHTDGAYGDQPRIYQARGPVFHDDHHFAVIGSWIVDDRAAGMGIREDVSPITRNTSRFVPHVIA